MWIYVVAICVLLLIMSLLIPVYRGMMTGQKAKKTVIFNLLAFFSICLIMSLLPLSGVVHAEGADTATVAATLDPSAGWGFLAAGLSMGLSAIGAGIAVASGASAAIGAISEDAKNLGRAITFVALGEGIAIQGLIVAIMIIGKY